MRARRQRHRDHRQPLLGVGEGRTDGAAASGQPDQGQSRPARRWGHPAQSVLQPQPPRDWRQAASGTGAAKSGRCARRLPARCDGRRGGQCGGPSDGWYRDPADSTVEQSEQRGLAGTVRTDHAADRPRPRRSPCPRRHGCRRRPCSRLRPQEGAHDRAFGPSLCTSASIALMKPPGSTMITTTKIKPARRSQYPRGDQEGLARRR